MKIGRLLELLQEFDRLSFAGGLDNTGIRSKGVNRKPDRRLPNYPYDTDVSYGQAGNYDRGGIGGTGTLNRGLTPKDDRGFSLRIMGKEDFADIGEAMGSPVLLSRGNSSDIGSTIPGVNGWANSPPKTWDEDDEDPIKVDPYTDLDADFTPDIEEASALQIDTSPNPDIEYTPDIKAPDMTFELDGEKIDPRIFSNPDANVMGPDPFGSFNTRMSSRGLNGMMPKESAWDSLKK